MRELARLQQQTDEAHVLLAGLRGDVAQAEAHAAELREVNAQLVVSGLRAQTDADATALALVEVSRSAQLDALTGLPNRSLLLDRLEQALAHAERSKARLALLFLDLDNFKMINDTLGHAVGDEVLKLAAHRIASSVRKADTVSRHGGDEFVILLAEVALPSDAMVVAEKVIASLGTLSMVGEHELRLTASIGISIYPEDGDHAETLIQRADIAMFRAKRQGLGSFVFHGDTRGNESELAPSSPEAARPPKPHPAPPPPHEHRHAQLQEANEQLVLAALTAQGLQSAAEQDQQRQTQFLAMLAHELRNPLTPIRSAAALLSEVRSDESLLPLAQGIIERQVVHMSRLLDDLLDISRVRTGKLRLDRQRVEVGSVIDAVIVACKAPMDTRLQRLVVDKPSHPLEFDGDPVRLSQIVSNLLNNASKYTQVGGEIRLSIVEGADAIQISVCDNGIGITPGALPHIFDPFVQDAHAIGFNGEGLGIGLTVVRELVESHGGSVVASSAGRGLGSTFVVTLPRSGS